MPEREDLPAFYRRYLQHVLVVAVERCRIGRLVVGDEEPDHADAPSGRRMVRTLCSLAGHELL
jgi:hypothetical protein